MTDRPRRCRVCFRELEWYGVQNGIEGWHETTATLSSFEYRYCGKHCTLDPEKRKQRDRKENEHDDV